MTVARNSHPSQVREVGDVAAPAGVQLGGVRGEVAADRSARAAAAGSAMVVFFQRRAARPGQPGLAHQPGDPLAAVPVPQAAQLGVHPRGAVAAPGFLVHGPDLRW